MVSPPGFYDHTELFSLSVSHSDSTRVDIFPPNYHRRERRKPNYLLHPPLSFFMTLIFKYGQWIKTEKLFYYYPWARPILSRQEQKGKKERKKISSHLSHLLFQFQGTGTRATKKIFFSVTFSYVVSIIWKCKALSTGCLSNSLSILVGAQKGLANESAINSHALTEKGNMPSARHIPRFSAHCRHGDWWCSSLMWDDCQLFLNKYKKKQRNLHPFQPEWIISYFPGLRIHGAWKLKVNNEP